MYKNFDEFYSEVYSDFYNTCQYKEIISIEPIPHKIDADLGMEAQYKKGIVIFQNSSVDTSEKIRLLMTDIYHELTHYYDELMFQHIGYSNEDIDVLMLTYSEIHAAYNEMFPYFNLNSLSISRRIDLNKEKFKNRTMADHIIFQTNRELQNMNNPLGFKYAMYMLGHKRALLRMAKDVSAISRIYNPKYIPKSVREEIVNIDKLVNLNSYEDISVEQLKINKQKVDCGLMRISIESI
ncbi:MAG: hypothetical protein NC489_21080 [Ruminococcus flavefaciens]|nr:hypothetical protein [Ruminococcus flavefaciens]